jgi:YbgC/YbaW family acyl-CoA thioester hydrolase
MSDTPFAIHEYVRWSDVDNAGIIFYGAYVRFFEIAETELFRAAGVPYGQVFDRFGIWLPRVHLSCDFMQPVRLDDRLQVATYIAAFGRSSIELRFDVLPADGGRLAASGTEVLVSTDRESMRPIETPTPLREALAPYAMTQEQARQALGVEAA